MAVSGGGSPPGAWSITLILLGMTVSLLSGCVVGDAHFRQDVQPGAQAAVAQQDQDLATLAPVL